MKKTDRLLKEKRNQITNTVVKPDTTKNTDGLEEIIQRHQSKQKRLYPLRINKNTVIYVTKNKCNKAYAEEYQKRIENIHI